MIHVVTNLAKFQKKDHESLVVALGNFDGVHVGHQAILNQIKAYAKDIKGKAAVLTFDEHPQRVLHKKGDPLLLTSFHQKLALLNQHGIALCILEKFTLNFSKQSPEKFVEDILVKQLGAKAVCMGFNAKFGHDRSGDAQAMHALAEKFHFSFLEVKPVEAGRVSVSSTEIRTHIAKGDLNAVQEFLGRSFSIYGVVERGSGRGIQIGFPTANLRLESEVLPPHGVYAVKVNIVEDAVKKTDDGFDFEKKMLQKGLFGVLNYGFRPTFGKGQKASMEVHLLGEKQDFLGKTLEVIFIQKLRDEMKFENPALLASQIKQDINNAKLAFSGKIPSLG